MSTDSDILERHSHFCAAEIYWGGLLTSLGANVEENNGFANFVAGTCSSDPAIAAVVTKQKAVKSESQHKLSVL